MHGSALFGIQFAYNLHHAFHHGSYGNRQIEVPIICFKYLRDGELSNDDRANIKIYRVFGFAELTDGKHIFVDRSDDLIQ